jgi:hypothetical protein
MLAPIPSNPYLEELQWRRRVLFEVRGGAVKRRCQVATKDAALILSEDCHVRTDMAPLLIISKLAIDAIWIEIDLSERRKKLSHGL